MQYEDSFSNSINVKNLGYLIFLIGTFFLCSSLFISILFFLPALIIGSFIQIQSGSLLKDKWSCSFFCCGFLILLNSLLQKFFLINNFQNIWNSNLTISGLANWLPFFWLFWAFQPFLESSAKRKKFAIILISGSLPLLFTGFGQYFLSWTGPFQTLNGLIIWYQRPIINPGGLSGLFSSQNYAGSWLNLIWPFCIALILEKTKSSIKRSIIISFFLSVGTAIFLTYSRSAWGGLILALPIVIGQQGILWIAPLFTFIFIFLYFYLTKTISPEIILSIKQYIPQKIYLEFANEGYESLDVTRIEILKSAIKIATIRPFVGIGAASFTAIFALQTTFYKGHSHNLLTELAISYGIPVAVILFLSITTLLIKSGYLIFFENKIDGDNSFIDRAFWASIFIFLLSQIIDIQYFDGKISIVAWILLTAIKKIFDEKKNLTFKSVNND